MLSALGTEEVARVRVGIGPPPAHVEAVDFVLSGFRPGEVRVMEEAVETAAGAVEDWVRHGIAFVMNRYNQKKEEPPKAESSS